MWNFVGGWGRTEANSYIKENDIPKFPGIGGAKFERVQVYLWQLWH